MDGWINEHSSSFSVDLSKLSAGLLNKYFQITFDMY